jgi:hypothetical protein
MPRAAKGKGNDPKTGASPGVPKTPEQWETFLTVLHETSNASRACEAAGISRLCAYDRRDADPDFAALWLKAKFRGQERMIEEVERRAFEGVKKPLFWQGSRIREYNPETDTVEAVDVREYSDALAALLIKSYRPEQFKDRTEVTTKNEGPGRPLKEKTDEELRERMLRIRGGK